MQIQSSASGREYLHAAIKATAQPLENSLAEKDKDMLMDNMLNTSQQCALAVERVN